MFPEYIGMRLRERLLHPLTAGAGRGVQNRIEIYQQLANAKVGGDGGKG